MYNLIKANVASVVLFLSWSVIAFTQSYPVISEIVTDKAQLFSNIEYSDLANKLYDYEESTTHQIVVLTIKSLGNNTIENYAYQVFNHDGNQFGQKGKDNGILILFALSDREVRIEVGDGLEPIITDATASRIIRQIIIPEFKDKNYYKGINEATSTIMTIIDDPKYAEEFANSEESSQGSKVTPIGKILAGLFITPILMMLGVFSYNRITKKKKKNRVSIKSFHKKRPVDFWGTFFLSASIIGYYAKLFMMFCLGLFMICFFGVFVFLGVSVLLKWAIKRAVVVFTGLFTGNLGLIIFPFYLPITILLLVAGFIFTVMPIVMGLTFLVQFVFDGYTFEINHSVGFALIIIAWVLLFLYCIIRAIYDISQGPKSFGFSLFRNNIKLETGGKRGSKSKRYSSSGSSSSSSRSSSSRGFSGGGGSSSGGGASGSW